MRALFGGVIYEGCFQNISRWSSARKEHCFFLFTFIVENFFEILFLKFVMGPTVGSVRAVSCTGCKGFRPYILTMSYTVTMNDISLREVSIVWLFKILKLRGSYVYHLLQYSKTLPFISTVYSYISCDGHNKQQLCRQTLTTWRW